MTDVVNPKSYPEHAAFQLVIELVKAERVPMHHDNVTNLLKIYDEAVQHFKSVRKDGGLG